MFSIILKFMIRKQLKSKGIIFVTTLNAFYSFNCIVIWKIVGQSSRVECNQDRSLRNSIPIPKRVLAVEYMQ